MTEDLTKVEYRVRTITRYVVTRYHEIERGSGSEQIGEYSSEETAYSVGHALCKAEHERLGWPLDDNRIQYPRRSSEENAVQVA